jgi:hypothetical protein
MSEYIQFLVGLSSPSPPSLPEVITRLRDASALFCSGWLRQDFGQAQRASRQAMEAFDHICNAFLRGRDDAIAHQIYTGPLKQFMATKFGKLASSVTKAEQEANAAKQTTLGNACLPARFAAPPGASFDVALNKVKHRTDKYSNFRVTGGRHILIVAGDLRGRPDYLFEFDVIEFCDLCDLGCPLIT